MSIPARRSKESGVQMIWNGDEVKRRAEILATKSPFEIGLVVEGDAKMLCPVDTGRLKGSITVASGDGKRTSPRGNGNISTDFIRAPSDKFETFVGTPVEYGPYMEYGTIRTSAQPFLRPALDMARGRATAIVQVGAKREFAEYLTTKDAWKSSGGEGFME